MRNLIRPGLTGLALATTLCLAGAAAAQGRLAAAPPAWNGQDAFLVWKAAEPEATKTCPDRRCSVRDGGLGPYNRDPQGWHSTVYDAALGGVWTYGFHSCRPDQTGCKQLDLFFTFDRDPPTDATLKRYQAGPQDCLLQIDKTGGWGDYIELHVKLPLSARTSLAEVQAAKARVLGCRRKMVG